MRKHAVLVTLVVVEALAQALLAFYWFVMRADLGYAGAVEPMGLAAKIAVSPWFAWSVAAGALPVLASLVPGWRPRARHWLAGTGVVWTVFGLTYAVAAAYLPAFASTPGT